jgi:radical SAM enzyme (TIGR01210 family)
MKKKEYSPDKPVAAWTSTDRLPDDVIPSLTMILRTHGCYRSRGGKECTMCGFARDSATVPPSHDELVAQFRDALARRPDGERPKYRLK